MKDRLPDMKEIYRGSPLTSGLVATFNGRFVSCGAYEETHQKRERRWIDRHGRRERVTHWQPLPAPPEGAKQ